MQCPHCGRNMSPARLRCQACKTRLIAGYLLPALIVIAVLAVIMFLAGFFRH